MEITQETKVEVVSIRFKNKGKSYYFAPEGHKLEKGQQVIVETSKGPEFGVCIRENFEIGLDKAVLPLRPVLRMANKEDIRRAQENEAKEDAAMKVCIEKIREHQLDMKLVDVEYNFEGSKILFFFTSEGRVDFRELVKDLASIFRTRIELRQIGVRDEARMLGGLGICGKPFCCSQFLDDFQPVSIKMAKTQNLSLNPTKISGTCGRLMCCLKYEQDAYEELVKNAPKVDSYVQTPEGNATITEINLLRQKAKVRLETQGGDPVLAYFPLDEISFIKTGKQRRAELLEKRQTEKTEPTHRSLQRGRTYSAEGQEPAKVEPKGKPGGPRPPQNQGEKPKKEGEEKAKRPPNRRRKKPNSKPSGDGASS